MNQIATFIQNLDKIKQKRVVVVGDVFIDEYCFGKASRISSGIPTPIIRKQCTQYCMGGAANVAANVAGLGADCTLIGRIGRDCHSETLYSLAASHGITIHPFATKYNTVKQRVYNEGHQILRIDTEHYGEPVTHALSEKITRIHPHLIIAADYKLGVINQRVIDILGTYANKHHVPFIFNSRNPSGFNFSCASAAVLNQGDLGNMQHTYQQPTENDMDYFITMGKNGIKHRGYISTATGSKHRCSIGANVSGAGDSVLAVISLLYRERIRIQDLLHIANLAGGLAVSHPLTYTLTRHELISSFYDSICQSCSMAKALPETHAVTILDSWKKCGTAARIIDCSFHECELYNLIPNAYEPQEKLVIDTRQMQESILTGNSLMKFTESSIIDMVILPDSNQAAGLKQLG